MDPNPKHEAWIREFAVLLRKRFPTIPEEVRIGPHYVAFAITPCQVLSVNLEDPPLTWMFIMHVSGVPDLTVKAYGPATPPELLNVLEDSRKDPVFDAPIPKETGLQLAPPAPPTLRSYFEREAVGLLERVRAAVFDSPTGTGLQGTSYLPVCNILTLQGNVFTASPADTLESWVKGDTEGPLAELRNLSVRQQGSKSRAELLEEAKRFMSWRDQRMDWRGVFFYPPIRVGDPPKSSLREQLPGSIPKFDLGPAMVEGNSGGTPFWATYYGCLGVKETDERRATLLLNMICAALHFAGFESYPVRQGELLKVDFDPATKAFLSTSTPPSERSAGNKDLSRRRSKTIKTVSPDAIRAALQSAEKFVIDPSLCLWLPLVLDSFSRIDAQEWDYGFYSSWLVIESALIQWFDEAVSSGVINQGDYTNHRSAGVANPKVQNLPGKLRAVVEGGVGNKLETLNLFSRIKPAEYALYVRLRNRRNEILHPAVPATEQDARDCFQAAESIVRTRI